MRFPRLNLLRVGVGDPLLGDTGATVALGLFLFMRAAKRESVLPPRRETRGGR